MRLEAIEFAPVTSELTGTLPKSTCTEGENSCWSSSSTSYYFHLAGRRTMEMPFREASSPPPPPPPPSLPIKMTEQAKEHEDQMHSQSERKLQVQGESGSQKRRRRSKRRKRSSNITSISITSSSRHPCSFHHKVPLVSSSTCSSSLVRQEEEDCDEADIEDEEMKKHRQKKVAHFAMSSSAAPYFTSSSSSSSSCSSFSLDYGSFLFSLMISLNLWIKDCSAKGTGVIGAAAGGSDSGEKEVCSECGGNYTTEEMQMAISLCSLILLCFFGILCCQCYNRFYYEFVEHHEHYHETKGMPPPPYIRNSLFKNQL